MTTATLRDWRDELKGEIEEANAEIAGILEEIRDARERLAIARQIVKDRKETLAYVRGQLTTATK